MTTLALVDGPNFSAIILIRRAVQSTYKYPRAVMYYGLWGLAFISLRFHSILPQPLGTFFLI